MPRRRQLLALAAAGVGGLGAYGTYRYASGWERETCVVERHSQSQTVPTGGSFRHYHGDVTHSGFVRTEGSADTGTEYWRTDTGTTPVGLSEPQSVAVADGRVFLTSTWRVLALDQTSGELLWCTEAGRMFMTAPTVSDGTVVFGTELPGGRGGVIAFDAADGTRRWRFPGRGPFTPRIGHPLAVPTVHRGTVYVGGGGGRAVLTALDLTDGSVQWRTDLGDGGVTPPAVDGDRLFVQRSGELLALEASDGSIVWRSHAGGPALPPTSTDERVFGTASETGICAWDLSTGRR